MQIQQLTDGIFARNTLERVFQQSQLFVPRFLDSKLMDATLAHLEECVWAIAAVATRSLAEPEFQTAHRMRNPLKPGEKVSERRPSSPSKGYWAAGHR
jgi:hypothetical protein